MLRITFDEFLDDMFKEMEKAAMSECSSEKTGCTCTAKQPARVIFNDPATIVIWEDGSKTIVKAQDGEVFDKEKGLAMALVKKAYGNNTGEYNEIFKKWVKE